MMEKNGGVSELLHPVETKRASEAIYEQVKGFILSGQLQPGERLPSERNMMDLFQRSRPTIREALRMLERAGYIRIAAGSNGAVVLKPDEKNIEESVEDALRVGRVTLEELSEYRSASEVATVGWAAQRRTQEDIGAMEDTLKRMEACANDYDQFAAFDPQFHGLLAAAAQNRIGIVMSRAFSNLNRSFMREKMRRVSQQEQMDMIRKICAQHRDIFDAVCAQDVDGAQKAMAEHLSAFGADLRE